MAYPFVEDTIWTKMWKMWISKSDSDEKGVMIADHDSSQSEALKVHLESLKDQLCNCKLSATFNVESATNKVMKIYYALECPEIYVHGHSQPDLWISKELFKVSILVFLVFSLFIFTFYYRL